MQTPKLLIYLAVWKRPEITEICFMGIHRLRKSGLFPIEAFAVISEESMIPLCEKYGIGYCFYKNDPVGEKKNFGLTEAYKREWDYMIEIGSDDLLRTEYLEAMAPYFGKHDLLGIGHVVYINSEDGACRRYQTKTSFGCGRAISRAAINKVGTKLWADRLNKGMDNNSMFFLARHGVLEKKVISSEPLAIDIKGPDNIWPFNYLIGVHYELEDALKGLSEEETNAIRSLINVTV